MFSRKKRYDELATKHKALCCLVEINDQRITELTQSLLLTDKVLEDLILSLRNRG